MEWITEVWNNEGEIEIWGSKLPLFIKVLTIFVSLEFSVQGRRVLVDIKGKLCQTEIPHQMEIFLLPRRCESSQEALKHGGMSG